MKTSIVFTRFSIPFVTLLLFFSACYLNDKDAALSDDSAKVSTRADDCSDCDDDCCCFVELDGSTTSASLLFCGTLDGASVCSEPNCFGIMGGGQLITLSTGTPRKLFCMGLNSPFRIWNFGTNDVDIIVSCTTESGLPQTIMIHLDAGDKAFISTDGDCEVDEC
jgi:hypothetical protein